MALRERLIGNQNGPGVSDGTGQHSFQEMKAPAPHADQPDGSDQTLDADARTGQRRSFSFGGKRSGPGRHAVVGF